MSAAASIVEPMVALNALSPSRANDFVQCPLKFRFRTIDKIPEPPSPAAFRGTLVHAVLEHLFDLEAEQRTPDAAIGMIPGQFETLSVKDPNVGDMYRSSADKQELFDTARALVEAYFALEMPERLEPARREQFVTVTMENGLKLRGFIDRVDRAPGGEVRLVDYKTGKQPKPQYGREADFQMRFYAFVQYMLDETLVHTLQLMYLGSGSIKSFHPTLPDIRRTHDEILDIWGDITKAAVSGEWRPRKSPLCNWCHFKPMCPAWGNEAPEPPAITEIVGRSES